MKRSKKAGKPAPTGPPEEMDLDDAVPTVTAATHKLLSNFNFVAAAGLKNIRIPITSAAVAEDVPGSPAEPVFDASAQDDIQGNVIPGFNKDHQRFLFYRLGNVKRCKKFLHWLAPLISSMEEVLAFRRLFRAYRLKRGSRGVFLCSTWVNIAFSNPAIARLAGKADARAFGDASFRQGLAARSSYLGDPTHSRAPGHESNWVVGGQRNAADILIIVASDSPPDLDRMSGQIRAQATAAGMTLLYEQDGESLPGDLRGHEHFGFKDGVSQPGVRGKLSAAPGDYLTPRYFSNTDERRLYFAKPGQLLAWPGQFLLGELRQSTEHLYNSHPPAANFPAWARRGSYLVVRRLSQDVPLFWSFAARAAARLGMDPTRFASMLVGRWPSGAPIMRVPGGDDPALGADEFANNHFIFDDPTRPSNLRPIPGYPGDSFPPAMADFLGKVCPHFAHIRKVNPRDGASDLGKPEDNLARFILRRGIPFGPAIIGVKKPGRNLAAQERGLMFLGYASTIEDQFEFLQRRWSNSVTQPNLGGHDPIIGQNGHNGSRARFLEFPTAGGPVRLRFKEEWVVPTGGGYFFSPTLSAIRTVLAA